MSTLTQQRTAYDRARRLYQQGQLPQAAKQFRHWLKAHPEDARAHHDLSATLLAMGILDQAEVACAKATTLDPSFVRGWTSLATIQAARGQRGTPLKSLMQACKLAPKRMDLRNKLGVMLLDHNCLDEALRTFYLVQQRFPDCLDALSGAAMVLERQGRLEDAHALLADRIQGCATHARMGMVWGSVCRRLGHPAEGKPVLERMLASTELKKGGRMMMLYELGQTLHHLSDFDAAWQAIDAANDLQACQFDPKTLIAQTDQIIESFTRDVIEALPAPEAPDQLPILIVGVPRSGTSLVEQIFSAHPMVGASGELSDLQASALLAARAGGQPFPECMQAMTPKTASTLGQWYLDRRRMEHPEASRVTDKMPQNFQMLGLAAMTLPGATLIACERDPQDIALSCYFQNFKAPLAWSYRPEWIRVYIDQYRRLMDHWDAVMPGRVHRVQYESLVSDPEPHTKALMDAAGLSWDPAVLRHHNTAGKVHTASYAQATQPIYRSSVKKSAPYAKHLAPFFSDMEGV